MRPGSGRGRRPGGALVAGFALGGALLLGGCGGDGGGDSGDGGRTDARQDESASPDQRRDGATEPAATDPEVVRPYLEDLMARHDQVVNQLDAEPGAAADPDALLVQEYLHLFEPGSDFAAAALDAWAAQGEDGITIQPYDDEHPATRTRLTGDIEVVSPDEVQAPFCLEQRQMTYRDGEVVQGLPLLERPGEVVAVRVDGRWRLRSSDVAGDRSGCGGGAEEGGEEGGEAS